jgi:hypothetical protein
MTAEGQAAMTNALIGRTFELLTDLATLRLSTATTRTDTDYATMIEVEARLEAQILNLTVREARLVMEIGTLIGEKLP